MPKADNVSSSATGAADPSKKKKTAAAKTSKSKGAKAKKPANASAASNGASAMNTASSADTNKPGMTPEEHYLMVQEAAYHIAEKDGFQHGREQDYWLQAEREIEARLSNGNRSDVH